MKVLVLFVLSVALGLAQANNAVIRNKGSYRPSLGDYPSVVHLRFSLHTGTMGTCAGSLIHPRWVLTSARCIYDFIVHVNQFAVVVWIRYGVIDVPNPNLVTETFEGNVMHPMFDAIRSDIGLISLNRHVHSTKYIRPIRLQTASVNYAVGTVFTLCTWGINDNSSDRAEELRCTKMSSVNLLQADCQVSIPPFPFENLICANGPTNCNSDRGSPLMVEEEDGLTLIGVLYYGGANCDTAQHNDTISYAFTRISLPMYRDWIASVTGLDLSPPPANSTASWNLSELNLMMTMDSTN